MEDLSLAITTEEEVVEARPELVDMTTTRYSGGKPSFVFNLDAVRRLSAMQCSLSMIAAFFGVDVSTIKKRKRNDVEFRAAFEHGKEQGKVNLLDKQWRACDNSPAMLIWMGKNYLGQRDRGVIEHTGEGGGPIKFQQAQVTLIEKLKAFESQTETEAIEAEIVPEADVSSGD